MSANSERNKCKVLTNDCDLSAECPNGEGVKIASLGCKRCIHCYGEKTAFSIWCSYGIKKSD